MQYLYSTATIFSEMVRARSESLLYLVFTSRLIDIGLMLNGQVKSYSFALSDPSPIGLEPLPATLWFVGHLHLVHDHVVGPLARDLPLAHVPAHGDVEQHDVVPHGPRAGRDGGLHDGPPVDPPHHAALFRGLVLLPGELEAHGPARLHPLYGRADDPVLVGVLGRVGAPVKAGVVDAVAVPGLGDVDLAVRRPRKGFERQEPERGPDARRAGQGEGGDQAAVGARQALV